MEKHVVCAAKGVYRALRGSGLPTVGESMSWGATVDEVQTLSISGTPTGGDTKLMYQGGPGTPVEEETTALTFDEIAADVDTALEALSSIGAGDVDCAGGPWPGTAITVTFATLLADQPIFPLKFTDFAMTGGTNVKGTVTRTAKGCAGWTEVPLVDEAGVELTFLYEGEDVEELGRKMPIEEILTKYGLASIKFQVSKTTEAMVDLALPDGDVSGAYMTGGADRSYIAMAIHTDNCVWYAPVVSATGSPALSYSNPNFTRLPIEFKCFEDKYAPKGESNWERHKIE